MNYARRVPVWVGVLIVLVALVVLSVSYVWAQGDAPNPQAVQVPVTPGVRYPGVYITGNYLAYPDAFDSRDNTPYAAEGDLVVVNWAYVEDRVPGQYDWRDLDKVVAWARGRGKLVSIMITTYNGWYNGGVVNAMPRYLWDPDNPYYQSTYKDGLDDGLPPIVDAGEWRCAADPSHQGCVNGHWVFPRYWSQAYRERYAAFLRALGERYGDEPLIEFIAMGIGMYGENYAVDYWARDLKNLLIQEMQRDLNTKQLFCETWSPPCTRPLDVWVDFVQELEEVYRNAFPNKVVLVQQADSIWNGDDKKPILDHANSLTPPVGLSFNMMYPQWFWAYGTGKLFFDLFPPHGPEDSLGQRNYHFPVAVEGYWNWIGCEGDTQVYWSFISALSKHTDYWRLNYDLLVHLDRRTYAPKWDDPRTSVIDMIRRWKPYLGRRLGGPREQEPPGVFVALRDHRSPWFTCMRSGPPVDRQRTGYGYPEYGDYTYWLYHDRNVPGGRSVAETGFPYVMVWDEAAKGFDSVPYVSVESIGNPYLTWPDYNPHPYNSKLPRTKESWVTRRTDIASGNSRMYFKIDDRYLHDVPEGTPITITVTYLNDTGDAWSLVYDSHSGPKEIVVHNDDPEPAGLGGGQWITHTFVITDGRFANGLMGQSDFYLDASAGRTDGQDNWFHMVHVTKGPAYMPALPTPGPTPTPTPTPLPPTPTPTPTPTTATVRGKVFNDFNQNGRLDPGEPGVAGARVMLIYAGSQLVGQHTTDATGEFEFTDLQPGLYVLRETNPAGYEDTTPNFYSKVLNAGEVVTWNFGDYRAVRTFIPVLWR